MKYTKEQLEAMSDDEINNLVELKEMSEPDSWSARKSLALNGGERNDYCLSNTFAIRCGLHTTYYRSVRPCGSVGFLSGLSIGSRYVLFKEGGEYRAAAIVYLLMGD